MLNPNFRNQDVAFFRFPETVLPPGEPPVEALILFYVKVFFWRLVCRVVKLNLTDTHANKKLIMYTGRLINRFFR